MAVDSKAVIAAYYEQAVTTSFWNGCSTGGRQGLSEAEDYPTDLQGILAGAPALSYTLFQVAQMWPQYVMILNHDVLPTCKETLVDDARAAQCPDSDGQVDGVYDPRTCDVDGILEGLVGTVTPCGTFTQTDADVILAIWQGPCGSGSQDDLLHGSFGWFGLEPGATSGR